MILRYMLKYLNWTDIEELLQEVNFQKKSPVHLACLWRKAENVNILLMESAMRSVIGNEYPILKARKIATKLVAASRRTLLWSLNSRCVFEHQATLSCTFWINSTLFPQNSTLTGYSYRTHC